MTDEYIKRKRGRPRKDEPNKSITPKKQSNKKIKTTFNENDFWRWLSDCATIVLPGWELKTITRKNYIEIVKVKGEEQMPFAFIDRDNGNIHCPAIMDGDPHDFVRGNISDPITRLTDITPYGVKAYWTWQPTNENYTLHKKNSLSLEHLSSKID